MSEMVERVSRAICVANGEDPDKMYPYVDPGSKVLCSFGVYQPQWFHVLPLARAAIAAMREPTKAMIESAEVEAVYPAEHWRTMIDEALKDTP
jgi:hypothetical protein